MWHSPRRLARVLLFGAVLAGACSSDQSGSAPSSSVAAPLTAQYLDRPGCDAVERFFSAEEDDTFWYGVSVDRDEVARRFAAGAAVEAEIVSGPLADQVADIERWYDLRRAHDELLLAAWGSDGLALKVRRVRENSNFLDLVASDGFDLGAGDLVSLTEFKALSREVHERMFALCTEAPSGYAPLLDDQTLDLPAGQLLFEDYLDDERVIDSIRLDDLGARSVPWTNEPWTGAIPSPDGSWVRVYDVVENQHLVVDREGELINFFSGSLRCSNWYADGSGLVGTEVDDQGVRVVGADVGERDPQVELLFEAGGDVECVVGIDGGFAHVGSRGPLGVWAVDSDGGDARALLVETDCNALLSGSSPDGVRLLATASCGDRYRSGLYVLDTRAATASQLVSGTVAAPQFSDDGEWIVFGYQPHGEVEVDLAVWIITTDGSRARKLVDRGSWPALLLDP
ncbi:MAG: hypothetical protein HKN26_00175 [Acidimicrobiales bacterium]|nr:hypothetical protein [Acidimicrobiales bacterium]